MATIKDVAREAGVSIATVSRVFNASAVVSEPTQRAVREVAARLNYWPNGAARSLITNRTQAIGVLLPDRAWTIIRAAGALGTLVACWLAHRRFQRDAGGFGVGRRSST